MRKKSWYAHTQVDGTIRFFVQRSLDTSPEYQGIKTRPTAQMLRLLQLWIPAPNIRGLRPFAPMRVIPNGILWIPAPNIRGLRRLVGTGEGIKCLWIPAPNIRGLRRSW